MPGHSETKNYNMITFESYMCVAIVLLCNNSHLLNPRS